MGGCILGCWLGRLVGSWVGSCEITKNEKRYIYLIEIIQFSLKIYDLLRHPYLWMGVWVYWWLTGWVG